VSTRKQIGYIAAAVSLASLLLAGYWPEAKSYHEILVFPWFCGGFSLLSICGSIIAGRLLSPRWYYLAIFWAIGAVTLVMVMWIAG
jgi:hypothetical protein